MTEAISRRALCAALLAVSVPPLSIRNAKADERGRFVGSVTAEWLSDGRRMKLAAPFEYVGADRRRWPVPQGTIVDGASIPQIFWSVIGGPFEGHYRGPSVVHDFYCESRTRRCQDVHKVFYEACLDAGVSSKTAWLMYRAVSVFGPVWPEPKTPPGCDVVDQNYDFQRCAQNAVKPAITWPKLDRIELLHFIDEETDRSNSEDIAKLKQAVLANY
jgi:hypothetical protein